MMIRTAIPSAFTTDIGTLMAFTNARASAYGLATSKMIAICIHSATNPTAIAVVQRISRVRRNL